MNKTTAVTLCVLAAIGLNWSASAGSAQEKSKEGKKYSYATSGVLQVPNLKLLLDEATLGGKELEMAEITFPAGTVDDKHQHGSVEIFYVLSGKFGHEVNGELHWLTPGMVGVVRPGDTVRHIAPKTSDVKVLVIWTPAGEAKQASNFECTGPKS